LIFIYVLVEAGDLSDVNNYTAIIDLTNFVSVLETVFLIMLIPTGDPIDE